MNCLAVLFSIYWLLCDAIILRDGCTKPKMQFFVVPTIF